MAKGVYGLRRWWRCTWTSGLLTTEIDRGVKQELMCWRISSIVDRGSISSYTRMASRIFSRRLLLLRQPTPLSSLPKSTAGCFCFHPRHLSAEAEAVESNQDVAAKPEQLSPMLTVFEDMIHGMIVQRCQPEWLPFVPGSSFWVPPRPKSGSFIKEIEKLSVVNRPLSDEETMSLTTMRGWPSSSFFLQGNETESKKSNTGDKDTSAPVADSSSSEDKNDE